MNLSRRSLVLGSAAVSAGALARPAFSPPPTIKIGVPSHFSGLYTDLVGRPGVECAKQAVEEFTAKEKGFGVEVVFGDHQNKADVGSAIVRRWLDNEGVDMVIAGPNSSVGLAASFICKERDKA